MKSSYNKVKNLNKLDKESIVKLQGISGSVKLLRNYRELLKINNIATEYSVNVVEDFFSIPIVGLLGADFLKENNGIINVESFT